MIYKFLTSLSMNRNQLFIEINTYSIEMSLHLWIVKKVNLFRDKKKLWLIISQCLGNTILIWHSTKLSDVEKNIYRNMSLQNWCNVLIKRFKKRISAILNYLQFAKYTLQNVRMHKNFKNFAQNLFRHVKTISLISVYN